MNRTLPQLCLALAMAVAAPGFAVASCEIESVRQALPVRDAAIAPISSELAGGPRAPGFVAAVFAPSGSEALALDRVLLRQRLSGCIVDEFAGYAPRTQFDNTPWRFNAGGDGRNFDADEFDAWMKQRGVRIAKGKTADEAPVQAEAPPATLVQ